MEGAEPEVVLTSGSGLSRYCSWWTIATERAAVVGVAAQDMSTAYSTKIIISNTISNLCIM